MALHFLIFFDVWDSWTGQTCLWVGKGSKPHGESVPRAIGAAFNGVFTGVGAVSEDAVPLAALIGTAFCSSDILRWYEGGL